MLAGLWGDQNLPDGPNRSSKGINLPQRSDRYASPSVVPEAFSDFSDLLPVHVCA